MAKKPDMKMTKNAAAKTTAPTDQTQTFPRGRGAGVKSAPPFAKGKAPFAKGKAPIGGSKVK